MEIADISMQDVLTEYFETHFDAIYVIFYTGNMNRLPALKNELQRVGLLNCKNLHWYYDVKSPYDDIMFKDIKIYYPEREANNQSIKKLAMNHYKISKISHDLGYNKILILEDDIRFLNNLETMYNILQHTPDDGDIILYDKMIYQIDFSNYQQVFGKNLFLNYSGYNLYTLAFSSAALYALSRIGMEEIIANNEKFLTTADTYTNNVPGLSAVNLLKRYVANINLGIQNAPVYFENHYLPFVDLSLYNIDKNVSYETFIENI